MTPAEILAMSGEVVNEFWPDWYKPCELRHRHEDFPMHDRSPDLTEPANFVRALTNAPVGLSMWREVDGFYVRHRKLSQVIKADTPELALLLALHALWYASARRKADGK